jgi:hypothetical protein
MSASNHTILVRTNIVANQATDIFAIIVPEQAPTKTPTVPYQSPN